MRKLIQIASLALTCAAGAQGTSEAIFNVSATLAGQFTGTAGWTFQPKVSVGVTEIGVFTNIIVEQGSMQVGLWNSSGVLLRSNTVTAADSQVNESYYASVEPLWLVPLQTYHIGVFAPGGTIYLSIYDPGLGGSLTMAPQITLGGIAETISGWGFPGAVPLGDNAMWVGPNFRFIPEPGSLALAGCGAAFLLLVRRRRRK